MFKAAKNSFTVVANSQDVGTYETFREALSAFDMAVKLFLGGERSSFRILQETCGIRYEENSRLLVKTYFMKFTDVRDFAHLMAEIEKRNELKLTRPFIGRWFKKKATLVKVGISE